MNFQTAIPQHWWERIRWARHGFLAGIVLGLLMGWFFHGVISLVVRFGLVLLLLLPLLAIGYFWWRSSRAGPERGDGRSATQVMTWTSGTFDAPRTAADPFARRAVDPEADGIPTTGRVRAAQPTTATDPTRPEPRTSPLPQDVEAELRELKRRQETGR